MSQGYILLLDQPCGDRQLMQSLLSQLQCSVVTADSAEQAVVKAQQVSPYLVILMGNRHIWSQGLIDQLREALKASGVTIVALTESHDPSWFYQEENPGLDGFLVKPLTGDVLTSVVQSAQVKHIYC